MRKRGRHALDRLQEPLFARADPGCGQAFWREQHRSQLAYGLGLDGIHLPKVHRPATLVHVDHYLTLLERLAGLPAGSVRMMAWIESTEGVANVEAICAASPRLVAVSVGSEDYAASLGVSRSAEGTELAFARTVPSLPHQRKRTRRRPASSAFLTTSAADN